MKKVKENSWQLKNILVKDIVLKTNTSKQFLYLYIYLERNSKQNFKYIINN